VDTSTTLDHLQVTPTMAGLGTFFVNTQVQSPKMIYIKVVMTDVHYVLMAEYNTPNFLILNLV
jgi:hypothetical protein